MTEDRRTPVQFWDPFTVWSRPTHQSAGVETFFDRLPRRFSDGSPPPTASEDISAADFAEP